MATTRKPREPRSRTADRPLTTTVVRSIEAVDDAWLDVYARAIVDAMGAFPPKGPALPTHPTASREAQ